MDNVVNPVPAMYVTNFQGSIGVDTAVPNGGGLQLQPATFNSCTVTFDTAYVNKSSTMIVTLDPKNSLDSSSYLTVQFPTLRRWVNNINTGDTIALANSMVCNNQSTNVAASPGCSGDLGTFLVYVTSLFTTTVSTSFSFGITALKSPPTL